MSLLAALMLAVSTFLDLYTIGTGVTTLREFSGYDHHSIAMLLLGGAAIPMVLGALRGARPAMAALTILGALVILVAFTADLPTALDDEPVLSEQYEGAEAKPAVGFYVETIAGAMLLAAGGVWLMLTRGRDADEAEAGPE